VSRKLPALAELAMALNVTLVVVGGDVKTPEVKLRLPSTVGRGRDCSIMLRHPLVSRQHCELFESAGTLLVRDLGSLNGTFVNNQRIEGDAPLQPGQLLTIGTVTFRAMYDLANAAESPPDTPPPQMKSTKPSSETNADGTLAAPRPAKITTETVRNPPPSATPPTEPVDVDMDFDLDDAKPLFAEMDEEKTSEDLSKNGAGKKGSSGTETVYAPSKGKPAAPPPAAKPVAAPPPAAAKPAAPVPPPPKPAAPAKPADEKSAAKTAPPAKADAPAFDFLESDGGGNDGEDDDLNDFLKNLK
jgi:predicted component of type VI protein secretion system